MNDRVDVANGLRTEPASAIAPTGRKEVGVESVQFAWADVSQIASSERWKHVVHHVSSVGLEGARLHLVLNRWKPLVLCPVSKRHLDWC